MQKEERMKHLLEIAEQDEIYKVWKKSYKEIAVRFENRIKFLPRKLRGLLLGYGNLGRLMYQRIVNIACENMDFVESE